MSKVKQTLKSGDQSQNTQIQTLIVKKGLDYKDIKEIALDIFNSNFLALKNEAIEESVKRANELTEKFVTELKERGIESIEGVKDPGFQYSLFEAQKNYARTGDKDMEAVLIDILADRLSYTERNLRQIVLDESIQIISKLTNSQLDTLTILFLLKYSQNTSIGNIEMLKGYLEIYIKPFTDNLSKENSLYQHLEYTGCGSISMGSNNIENIFRETYRGLFFIGFNEEEIKNIFGNTDYKDLVIKCLNNEEKMQFKGLNKEIWKEKIKEKGLETNIESRIINSFDQNILSNKEIKDKLIELGGEEINNLFDIWENSQMKNMTLTSVGIAIAQANFRRKTGITLDLSIWIK